MVPATRPSQMAYAKLFAACAFFVCYGCATTQSPADIIVKDITIYDGQNPAPFIGTVAIRDGKFLAVTQQEATAFRAAETIEGAGRYMTPGLWDAHAHVRSSKDRGLDTTEFLRFGVTSIHDLGGYPDRTKVLEEEIASDIKHGPNIYSVYFMLNGQSFEDFQHAVTSEAEIADAIEYLAAAGAAQIKIHRALSPELFPVLIEQANKHGLKVTGHIPLGLHPMDACKLGMGGVEHIGSFAESYLSVLPEEQRISQAGIDYLISEESDPLYACLTANDVAVTPTLVIYPSIARRRTGAGEIPQKFIDFIEQMKAITLRLHQHDVILLAGTDTSDYQDPVSIPPGLSLHDELRMLEDAGIAPRAIITMATLNSARAIGKQSSTGSIETGKDADFLLLSEDPGESVHNLQSIIAVYKSGREVTVEP